jgi:hypothetical protein
MLIAKPGLVNLALFAALDTTLDQMESVLSLMLNVQHTT